MSPDQRHDWIEGYLQGKGPSARVDVLDRAFVDAYDAACAPAHVQSMPYGANKVPQLGSDLAAMARCGRLTRRAVGIQGMRGMGFPAWVYAYRLPQAREIALCGQMESG